MGNGGLAEAGYISTVRFDNALAGLRIEITDAKYTRKPVKVQRFLS